MASGHLNFTRLCASCKQDKPLKGGTLQSIRFNGRVIPNAPKRFTCATCIAEKAKKVTA